MKNEKISERLVLERYTKTLRDLSRDTRKISLTEHAEERMWERNINYDLLLKAMRQGEISYEGTNEYGDPKLRAILPVRSRSISAICGLVIKRGRIVVITVMWNDPK